jgi:hypothetical protein
MRQVALPPEGLTNLPVYHFTNYAFPNTIANNAMRTNMPFLTWRK